MKSTNLPLQEMIAGVINSATEKLAADEQAEAAVKRELSGEEAIENPYEDESFEGLTDPEYVEKLASACSFIAANVDSIEKPSRGVLGNVIAKMAAEAGLPADHGIAAPPVNPAGALEATMAMDGAQKYKKDKPVTEDAAAPQQNAPLSAAGMAGGTTQLENNMKDAPGQDGGQTPTAEYPIDGPFHSGPTKTAGPRIDKMVDTLRRGVQAVRGGGRKVKRLGDRNPAGAMESVRSAPWRLADKVGPKLRSAAEKTKAVGSHAGKSVDVSAQRLGQHIGTLGGRRKELTPRMARALGYGVPAAGVVGAGGAGYAMGKDAGAKEVLEGARNLARRAISGGRRAGSRAREGVREYGVSMRGGRVIPVATAGPKGRAIGRVENVRPGNVPRLLSQPGYQGDIARRSARDRALTALGVGTLGAAGTGYGVGRSRSKTKEAVSIKDIRSAASLAARRGRNKAKDVARRTGELLTGGRTKARAGIGSGTGAEREFLPAGTRAAFKPKAWLDRGDVGREARRSLAAMGAGAGTLGYGGYRMAKSAGGKVDAIRGLASRAGASIGRAGSAIGEGARKVDVKVQNLGQTIAGRSIPRKQLSPAMARALGYGVPAAGASAVGAGAYAATRGGKSKRAADHARELILRKLAGEDVMPANISAPQSGGPLVGDGEMDAYQAEQVPSNPTDGSGYGNPMRKAVMSNQGAIDYTKRDAKKPQQQQMKEVLTEPAQTAKTDSKLNENLRNTGPAGVKIAGLSRAILQKIAEEGCTCEGGDAGKCAYCRAKASASKLKESMGDMTPTPTPGMGY